MNLHSDKHALHTAAANATQAVHALASGMATLCASAPAAAAGAVDAVAGSGGGVAGAGVLATGGPKMAAHGQPTCAAAGGQLPLPLVLQLAGSYQQLGRHQDALHLYLQVC